MTATIRVNNTTHELGHPDSMTPLGTKGIGELAKTRMAAAIANAVYHGTGTRIRSLPISIEKVLQ